MPLKIICEGENNLVDIDDHIRASVNGSIILRGNNNRITITGPFSSHDLNVDIADGSSVHIGAGCFTGMLVLYARRGGAIRIGEGSSFNGITRLLLHEPGAITIGRECLFGPDIDVVNSDMHSIIDLETGGRINPARDVSIGDRVWIGIKAFLAKGATVGDGSVVGAYSLVSSRIPAQCLAAGVPAKVLRQGIGWRFDLVDVPSLQEA